MQHHAIIATTWSEEEFDRMVEYLRFDAEQEHNTLNVLYGSTLRWSAQAVPGINGYKSITIFPDGSKEGWEASGQGDDFREQVIAQLDKANYSDGSSPWSYVEVSFGELGQKLTRGNNEW